MMLVQRLKRREGFEFGAAGALKLAERDAAIARVTALSKATIQRLQYRPFQRRHRAVIDQGRVAGPRDGIGGRQRRDRRVLGETRNRRGVDVEIVEMNAA
jgi:hypothetical protein